MERKAGIRMNRGSPRHSLRGGTLVGVFIGIVLGVMVAAIAVWFMNNKVPSPFAAKPTAPQVAGVSQPGAGADDVNQPLQGKPGDPPPKRFEFYDILPGTDKGKTGSDRKPATDTAATPDTSATTTPPPKGEKSATASREETVSPEKTAATATSSAEPAHGATPIYMQAGSFQDSADADNQKAKLALLGVEANVLQVMVQDKVWYRVRIGPYTKPEEASRVRAELAKQGIQVVSLK